MFNFFPPKSTKLNFKAFAIFLQILQTPMILINRKSMQFLECREDFLHWALFGDLLSLVLGWLPYLTYLTYLHLSHTLQYKSRPLPPPLLLTRLPSQGSLPNSRPCPRLLISTWYFWALDSCFLPSSTCTAVVSTLASILSVIKVLRLLRGVKITHNAILPQQKY